MRLQPTQDRVLVEMDLADAEFGDSGLVRPDTVLERPFWGTVRAVGPGVYSRKGFRSTTLTAGDRVMVPWATGADVRIGGRAHAFVREGDILAVGD